MCVLTHTRRQGKNLTPAAVVVILDTMPRKMTKPTMTGLLREALAEAKSLNSVSVATGVAKASLIRFLRGSQSLRLDIADQLASYFRFEVRREKPHRS